MTKEIAVQTSEFAIVGQETIKAASLHDFGHESLAELRESQHEERRVQHGEKKL